MALSIKANPFGCPSESFPQITKCISFEVFLLSSVSAQYIQGVSLRNGLYELALTDKDMQVRFGLKMILEC